MASYADRVKETTTTAGTGTITLLGAVAGFRTFAAGFGGSAVVNVTYCIEEGTSWEVGRGVFTAAGPTISRATVLASSNANALVSFGGSTKQVFCVLAAADISDITGNTLMLLGA